MSTVNGPSFAQKFKQDEDRIRKANAAGVRYVGFETAEDVLKEVLFSRQFVKIDGGKASNCYRPITGIVTTALTTATRGCGPLRQKLHANTKLDTQYKVAGWLRSFCFFRGNDPGTRGENHVGAGNVHEDNRLYNQSFSYGPFWLALKQNWVGNLARDAAVGATGFDNLLKGNYGRAAGQMASSPLRMFFHLGKAAVATIVMVGVQTARIAINFLPMLCGLVAELGYRNAVRESKGEPLLNLCTWDGAHTFFNRYDIAGTGARILANKLESNGAVLGRDEGGTRDLLVAFATRFADGSRDRGLKMLTGNRSEQMSYESPFTVWSGVRKMLCDPNPDFETLESRTMYQHSTNRTFYEFGSGAKTAKDILDENRLGYTALHSIANEHGADADEVIGVKDGELGFVTTSRMKKELLARAERDVDELEEAKLKGIDIKEDKLAEATQKVEELKQGKFKVGKINGLQGTVQILAALRTRYSDKQLGTKMPEFGNQTVTEYIKNQASLTRADVKQILVALEPRNQSEPRDALQVRGIAGGFEARDEHG